MSLIDLPPKPEIWLPPKPAIIRPAGDLAAYEANLGVLLCAARRRAAGGNVTVEFGAHTAGGVAANKTFTAQPVGTAAPDRFVATAVFMSNSATASALTVAGTASSNVLEALSIGSRSLSLWVTDSAITSGTAADVACTNVNSDIEISTWAIYGAATPGSPTTGKDTTSALDLTISGPKNGVVIAANISSGSITEAFGGDWGAAEEDAEVSTANYWGVTGSEKLTAAEPSLNITANFATAAALLTLAFAP